MSVQEDAQNGGGTVDLWMGKKKIKSWKSWIVEGNIRINILIRTILQWANYLEGQNLQKNLDSIYWEFNNRLE